MMLVWCLASAVLLSQSQQKKPPTPAKSPPAAKEAATALAAKAGAVLKRNCLRCHKGEGSESGYAFNVRSVKSLTENSVVTAGDPKNSELYDRIHRGNMPPPNQKQLPRPTPEEAEAVRAWIEAGAPEFPTPAVRKPIALKTMLSTIRTHFGKVEPAERVNVRYFTLTHLHNDPGMEEEHLRMARAALAKGLNSLSWEPQIVLPEAIDSEQTIFAVDVSRLGWKRAHWSALLAAYPYGLSFGSHEDRELRRIEEDLKLLAAGDRQLIHLRADWFVSVGLKPHLYHRLLYELVLPDLLKRAEDPAKVDNPKNMTALDLENFLKVDVDRNIFGDQPRASRAGYTESGISGQNRMVERHPLDGRRTYWKSYDFLASTREAGLAEFPLGPVSARNTFGTLAFRHDGGEIIFHLPNGLQGYLLANAKGGRLNAGPIEIVGDSLKTSGNQLIVNGLSCIACHRHGMIETPDDEVRRFTSAAGEARDRVEKLYPETKEMQKLVASDRKVFLESLQATVGAFLQVGTDKDRPLKDFAEPVGEVSRRFLLEPLDVQTVACELYEPDVERMRSRLRDDPLLAGLGLGALRKENGGVKRDAWESRRAFSLMQEVARQLGYTPSDTK